MNQTYIVMSYFKAPDAGVGLIWAYVGFLILYFDMVFICGLSANTSSWIWPVIVAVMAISLMVFSFRKFLRKTR